MAQLIADRDQQRSRRDIAILCLAGVYIFQIIDATVDAHFFKFNINENMTFTASVQNLFDKDSITGLYVTDQSSGNFTNIFTLEPRRYGVAAGFRF